MKLFLLFCFGFLFSQKVSGQTSDNSIEDIKIYVNRIDSLSDINTLTSDKTQLTLTISEGQIASKKKGLKGGFSDEIITSYLGDTLYLLRHHDNLEKNLYESYYYKSDKLVFSKIEIKDDNNTSATLFLQHMYYKDDKVIFSTVDKDKLKKKFKWRIDFDPLTHGYFYLKEHKKSK